MPQSKIQNPKSKIPLPPWLSLLLISLLTALFIVLAPHRADSRFDRLTQGINLAHWFAQAPLTTETFQTTITDADLWLIRDMGFRHVRLPIDPEVLFDPEHPDRLKDENLAYVDGALDRIRAMELAVIVDLHPQSEFKRQLYRDVEFQDKVQQFWRSLAHHLSSRDPNWLFLEVMNEPATRDPQDWYTLQHSLLAAMRAGAPRHTLIASGNLRVDDDWDSVRALTLLPPERDANIVYNFHFYKPMAFTHQGATWGEPTWRHLRQVPYPVEEGAIASLLPTLTDATARRWLQHYGDEGWNRDRIDQVLQQAEQWGRSHRVRVTCNEFGVYRHAAPPPSRVNWIRDVRSLLETHQIGWTMWEYKAGFGIVRQQGDRTIADPDLVAALFVR